MNALKRGLRLPNAAEMKLESRRRATFKIYLRLTDALHNEWKRISIEDGYGPKGKSKWLEDALMDLARFDPLLRESIRGENEKELHSGKTTVWLSREAIDVLSDMRRDYLSTSEDEDGVRGLVLRCALRHRLANPSRFLSLRKTAGTSRDIHNV